MARSINKVTLIGRLGNDPEVRSTPQGSTVVNLRIATSEKWKDKQTGEMQERTEWHTVVFFNQLAEIAGKYLRKGARVYVEGSLRTRQWQDKNGEPRYTTEIFGNEMMMLDSRDSALSPPSDQGDSTTNSSVETSSSMATSDNGPDPKMPF